MCPTVTSDSGRNTTARRWKRADRSRWPLSPPSLRDRRSNSPILNSNLPMIPSTIRRNRSWTPSTGGADWTSMRPIPERWAELLVWRDTRGCFVDSNLQLQFHPKTKTSISLFSYANQLVTSLVNLHPIGPIKNEPVVVSLGGGRGA